MRCHDSGQPDSVCRKSENSIEKLLELISEINNINAPKLILGGNVMHKVIR